MNESEPSNDSAVWDALAFTPEQRAWLAARRIAHPDVLSELLADPQLRESLVAQLKLARTQLEALDACPAAPTTRSKGLAARPCRAGVAQAARGSHSKALETEEPSQDNLLLEQLHRQVEVHKGLPRRVLHPSLTIRQQQEGSCVGQACASWAEWRHGILFSPLFIYRLAQQEDGLDGDVGCRLGAAIEVMQRIGCCPEDDYPDASDQALPYVELPNPQPSALEAAAPYRASASLELTNLEEVLSALAYGVDGHGSPVVITLPVFHSSMACSAVARDGRLLNRLFPEDPSLGEHSVLLLGYDLDQEILIFQESAGPEWGAANPAGAGCGDLSLAYFTEHASSAVLPVATASTAGRVLERFLGSAAQPRWIQLAQAGLLIALIGVLAYAWRPRPVAPPSAVASIVAVPGRPPASPALSSATSVPIYQRPASPPLGSLRDLSTYLELHQVERDIRFYDSALAQRTAPPKGRN